MPSAEVEVAVMFDGPGSLLVYKWEEERWLHPFVIDLLDAVYQVFSHPCLHTRGRTSWRGGEVAARIRGNQRFMQDPERPSIVSSIQSTPPELLKELQRFVGFSNFYRRFIKGFSKIVRPLTSLMSREKWRPLGPDALQAFKDLKSAFVSAPVLSYYRPDRGTVVEVDASDWAAGGVLSQYDDEGVLHPVAFFSAKHSPAECNYEIYDKELLAIVKAFEEWRPELQGLENAVEVLTDHKSLEHFTTTKLLNQRQVRWSESLSDFRYQITYRAGKHATVPDALSRKAEDTPASLTDLTDERISNRQRILLPPNGGRTVPDHRRHTSEHSTRPYPSTRT